jgi:hypothetical protein
MSPGALEKEDKDDKYILYKIQVDPNKFSIKQLKIDKKEKILLLV